MTASRQLLGQIFHRSDAVVSIRSLLLVNQRYRFFKNSSSDKSPTMASDKATVPITFVQADGKKIEVQALIGRHLLDVAHDNNVELEGACGGELACSTCHLIFPQEIYTTLPKMEEDEEDMLDLAYGVTETSRLGCQIHVTHSMAGMEVTIPDDGF